MARRLFWECWIAGMVVQAMAVRGDSVSTNHQRYNDGDLGHRPHLEFQSSSEFAPLLQVNTWDADSVSPTASHIFLKHDGNDSSPLSSPLILDAHDLSAVYMNRTFDNVFGTRVQENLGRKYLTFWAGNKGDGIGDGYGLAYDDTYRLVYKVSAKNIKVHADLHEFAFTGDGTVLVTGVDRIRVHGDVLREKHGWHSVVPDEVELDMLDGAFQEIDLETNEVLFDWRALDHVNPLYSFEPMGNGWDAYHINSIEKTQAGNYLISIRHTHSIYLIDGQTGAIIWTLGGGQNDFIEQQPSAFSGASLLTMAWQHHARFVPGTNESQMTFFDNHVKITTHGECTTDCSRGLHIAVNTTATPPTAQLLHQFLHPASLQAQSQGSVQPLAPSDSDLGNVFLGWGRCPTFTEHNSSGETVLDVQFSPWHSDAIPDALDNYRAYKMDWKATPWWDPAIALRQGVDETLVYVSWNGATEVASWVVKGSNHSQGDGEHDTVLATSHRTGFETRLTIGDDEATYRYWWADALDALGEVLRSSEIVDVSETSIPKDSYSSSLAIDAEFELESSSSLLSISNKTQSSNSSIAATDADSTPDPAQTYKQPTTALALLVTGVSILALAILTIVVVIIRRRRQSIDYDSLDLKESDFELDSDADDHEIQTEGHDGRESMQLDIGQDDEDDRRALLANRRISLGATV